MYCCYLKSHIHNIDTIFCSIQRYYIQYKQSSIFKIERRIDPVAMNEPRDLFGFTRSSRKFQTFSFEYVIVGRSIGTSVSEYRTDLDLSEDVFACARDRNRNRFDGR